MLFRSVSLGEPHPDAKGRLLKKKRTFRRDGTLAPPPWPVGGGGFNVSKKKKKSVNGTSLQSVGGTSLQVHETITKTKKKKKKKKRKTIPTRDNKKNKKKKKQNLDVFGDDQNDGNGSFMSSVGLF